MKLRSPFSLLFIFVLFYSSRIYALTTLGWSPWIDSNCISQDVNGQRYGICQIINGDYVRWLGTGTHENADFSGGRINGSSDVLMSDPIATINFVKRTDYPDKYDVQMSLDKINFPSYREHGGQRDVRLGYTGIFVEENSYMRALKNKPVFNLSQNVRIYLEVDFKQMERVLGPQPWVGMAEVRFIVGAVAVWDNNLHYVEVNLMRTPGFDRCGTQDYRNNPYQWRPMGGEGTAYNYYGSYICENSPFGNNVYDHRYYGYDTASQKYVELVYYYGPSLPNSPLQELSLNVPGYQSFDIPIAQLFRTYPWADMPNSGWASVKSHAYPATTDISFYFGVEIYGSGRAWYNFRTINVYTP